VIPTASTLQNSNAKKKRRKCEERKVRMRRRRGEERRGKKNEHLAAGYEATFLRSQFIGRRIRRAWVLT
jgi:sRNA-binding protein